MNQLNDLAALIERNTGSDGLHETALPGLRLARYSAPSAPVHGLHKPAMCIIAGGRKQAMIGDRIIIYDKACYLVVTADLPVVSQVIEASAEAPYLCFAFDLNPAVLAAMVSAAGVIAPGDAPGGAPGPGLALSRSTPELLDAAIRLMRLLDTPGDLPFLAPLVEREILYRLLNGDQKDQARAIAVADSRLNQVNRAIGWIRRNYAQPFTIGRVAEEARMSTSALHEHFKAVTAMSPLQYQKQIRLQEARQLILGAGMDAATAGHEVGYDSPSQFSREYRRLFGAPPIADAARLRARPELMAEI
ncbi:AraC family transcriptional regulator [Sphingobium boeckii]|uniref:AraC-like DNA-binding protein n=1 Tax=Sphingobium boeckii TaxID=1082345 RepID=A0A7W9AJ40_9SPHN|nr:AraC family transcriptional regulator [Sphingobium boeckii]MBB5686565.1 AraC-like DNA-binding protein [Sphingobium boeckii]